jgi:hypothetical protein
MTTIKKTTPKKRSSTLADKKTKTGRAKTPTHGKAGEEFAKSDMVGLWANHGIVGTSTDYVNKIRQKEQARGNRR